MSTDRRLVAPALAAWAGALCGVAQTGQWVVALAVALLLGWATLHRRHRALAAVLVVAAALLAGYAAGAMRVQARDQGPIDEWAEQGVVVDVRVMVVTDPRTSTQQHRWPGQAVQKSAQGRVTEVALTADPSNALRLATPVLLIGDGWPDLLPGARVRVRGTLAPALPGRPYAAVLRISRWREVESSAGLAVGSAEPLRQGLRQAAEGLPAGADGLLPALVVGDESGLDQAVVDQLERAGLSHLTAVSGANVAFALGALLWVATALGARARVLQVIALFGIVGFVVLARPQPSVVRAAVMAAIAVVAVSAGGSRRGLATVSGAVFVLVLVDPWLSVQPGFCLSVAATGGLVVLAPGWFEAAKTWLPAPLAAALAVALAAQIAVTPVLLGLTGEVNLAAIAANVLAEPAVPVATVLGLLAAVASLVSDPLAAMIAQVAGLAVRWILWVATWAGDLPGAAVAVALEPRVAVPLGLVAVCALVWAAPRLLRSPTLCGLVVVTLALALFRPTPVVAWPPDDWVLVACDVGQGDGLVVRTGESSVLVIDTGGELAPIRRCLDRLGVRAVDAVLLTHFHLDHVGGLAAVLEGYPVGTVMVSPLREPPEQVRRVVELATQADVAMTTVQPGQLQSIGQVSWRVLWPRQLILGEGSDANNASAVLLLEVRGVRVLLTGDIEPPAQKALLRAEPNLAVDVLKVPHHGSWHQDDDLLTGLEARWALISVGADNDYGHPAPQTINALQRGGAHVLRTDVNGAIAICVSDTGEISAVVEHP